MKFNEEQINKIINLKGFDGKLIDIFDLHGVLYIGNSKGGKWDISMTYIQYTERSIGFNIEYFEDCETEEDVNEVFVRQLREIVSQRLV